LSGIVVCWTFKEENVLNGLWQRAAVARDCL
jgi:hypothetical protein